MDGTDSGGKPSKGTGYLVLASCFGVLGLLILQMTLSEYACSDPTPKQCFLDEDKTEVLLVGLGVFTLFLGTAVGAVFARLRPQFRHTLNALLLTTAVLAVCGLLYFLVVLFAAGIRSTT